MFATSHKMKSLAGSLTDGVLTDTTLIPPCPPIPPTNNKDGKGSLKKYRN